ncbi:hypothetical protein B0H67DRAFT_553799 [Lasiosphaeris hirsuta]|uniref:Uncharacterized protein n=1 Tax=Lasiosphaeris hirsuta TaxID=260670 RepID=A0AA40AG36_9PEZI|nr:hypothetical protein B0H67DRAFT_553799 [Lasiosphaeris hirsuta]
MESYRQVNDIELGEVHRPAEASRTTNDKPADANPAETSSITKTQRGFEYGISCNTAATVVTTVITLAIIVAVAIVFSLKKKHQGLLIDMIRKVTWSRYSTWARGRAWNGVWWDLGTGRDWGLEA